MTADTSPDQGGEVVVDPAEVLPVDQAGEVLQAAIAAVNADAVLGSVGIGLTLAMLSADPVLGVLAFDRLAKVWAASRGWELRT